ncbi:glycine--tRNA ligase subunit beta [Acidibrevibacterium fodinaquatile]|uniref:glycine--tRNA ligase subunit beta n=1 Tax=Acidibrevibacterium fodinaquatile TaxID=1969806 RepID=UPI000E0DD345|nr:glycine--tRNA ligase subunit beta [Acidibrevibacterium fodinaquatile]
MPAFFLELFSEEIPARLQQRGAETLARLIAEALAPLMPGVPTLFWGPRRIALAVEVRGEVAARESAERGPRLSAPEAALGGFLRKHGAVREDLVAEGDYWVLRRTIPGQSAAEVIAGAMPGLLWRFPWPKSMRWGGKSGFTWVRPLRRILALLDGEVVRFDLRQGEDDGHGLVSGNETEGHRFMAPGAFAVHGAEAWQNTLRERFVIADPAERRRLIEDGIARVAQAKGLSVVPDEGLLEEVTGLVEWPVALLGTIDAAFMDLPPEVRQVSMRVNQRYFALRDADGAPAPHFAFIANIAAEDEGAAIIAGNERVLRARLSDARHFYDLDRRVRLESRVEGLKAVTFHAKLGTQYERAQRLARLAGLLLPMVKDSSAPEDPFNIDKGYAERAGLLAKADLTTGMVGEFPELQGVMGYYYARHDGEHNEIALAIRDHYLPKSGSDPVPPMNYAARAVALADKIDQLAGFFAIGEKPTGAGDPYALRRAALGIIQIIRKFALEFFSLREALEQAAQGLGIAVPIDDIITFVVERLRVQLRSEGGRHDVLAAVFAASADDNIFRLLARAFLITRFLASDNGANLLVAYRRAANILRIEDRKDGPHTGQVKQSLFKTDEEPALFRTLVDFEKRAGLGASYQSESWLGQIVHDLALLRPPIDAFFEKVTVNDPDPALRRNRLRLLSRIRDTMNRFADFSLIEG